MCGFGRMYDRIGKNLLGILQNVCIRIQRCTVVNFCSGALKKSQILFNPLESKFHRTCKNIYRNDKLILISDISFPVRTVKVSRKSDLSKYRILDSHF